MRKNREKKQREISVQNLMTKINIEINDKMNYLLRNTQTQINTLLENINQAQENQNKILLFSGILDVLHKSLYDKDLFREKLMTFPAKNTKNELYMEKQNIKIKNKESFIEPEKAPFNEIKVKKSSILFNRENLINEKLKE